MSHPSVSEPSPRDQPANVTQRPPRPFLALQGWVLDIGAISVPLPALSLPQ
ncbi:MAG: hypothetical protein H8E66_29675 [Planctomycetes bacterium]|nr:hypothetical protein [Planctomycetota bacterium]